MSDDRKGLSLRTKRNKRPPISAPKQISGPIQQGVGLGPRNGNKSSLETIAQPRPQLGGTTSDLVKRRYSTRFNNLPQDFDATAPPVPSIPSLPNQYAVPSGRGRGTPPSKGPGLTIDINALRDPSLRPEQYVTGLLSDASEQDISDYQQTLQKMRNRTSTDLQQNVYQNRTQFIKISKEAEKLKGEMRALRNLMAELKTNTIGLRSVSSGNGMATTGFDDSLPTTLSKKDRRSSVADRTALWNSQLQALWKSVEGSQKFLPAAVGRHVVQNAGIWVELDNATWKSRRAMQIILLNDHLLIAARRKKKIEGTDQRQAPSKLVADRCWSLLDIEIVDLAGASEAGGRNKVADAIMIRGVGQESFTYRTEKAEGSEKATLLINFRKAVEELRKVLRSEMATSNKTKDTINYFAARDPEFLKKADLLETLSDIKDRPNMLIEVDGKQQNLRWVESQVDELDIYIALQNFDAAVDGVEKLDSLAKGLKSNAVAQDFINFKANERSAKLATLITRELVDTHNELKKTKRNVSWLARLGFEDRAREAYLDARSLTIHKKSRQCIFEGNLHQYIWELSFVYFTIIRNTVSVFQTCFPPLTMSSCVKWAKEQVDTFNTILSRQLSSTQQGGPVWQECMTQVSEHAKMLSEVGLDFRNLIGREAQVLTVPDGPVGLGLT